MFAAILGSTGSVVTAIHADLVRRFHLDFLSWPFFSAFFWCLVAFAWTYATAEYTYRWWQDRLSPDDVPTIYDAQWFSYISTATIGLGDFYLDPEVIFIEDAFVFAFIFLAAFSVSERRPYSWRVSVSASKKLRMHIFLTHLTVVLTLLLMYSSLQPS
jgi:hypothetical protein